MLPSAASTPPCHLRSPGSWSPTFSPISAVAAAAAAAASASDATTFIVPPALTACNVAASASAAGADSAAAGPSSSVASSALATSSTTDSHSLACTTPFHSTENDAICPVFLPTSLSAAKSMAAASSLSYCVIGRPRPESCSTSSLPPLAVPLPMASSAAATTASASAAAGASVAASPSSLPASSSAVPGWTERNAAACRAADCCLASSDNMKRKLSFRSSRAPSPSFWICVIRPSSEMPISARRIGSSFNNSAPRMHCAAPTSACN
eukprot:scaffold27727_cov44-Phaeocystis_antarctica.AAC.1